MTSATEETEKIDIVKQVRDAIEARAAQATPEDQAKLAALLTEATTAVHSSRVIKLTAPMQALIFLKHNSHNRDWSATWTKELARRMTEGLWQFNNHAAGFYTDAQAEDGQHRFAAGALAGYELETAVTFGIHRDAITTVDDGHSRDGAAHAKQFGVSDSRQKQTILRSASSYVKKVHKDKSTALRSAAEMQAALRNADAALSEAWEIGKASTANIVEPVLKPVQAATVVYLLLTHGWTTQAVRESLALLQTGVSRDSDRSPYFSAADAIKASRKKSDPKDRLTPARELGVAILSILEAERGVKAITPSTLKNQVRKNLPDPAYPEKPAAPAQEPVQVAATEPAPAAAPVTATAPLRVLEPA